MSRLYAVRVVTNIVVSADNEAKAREVAETFERDERAHAKAESLELIVSWEDLPDDWDTGCLPYGHDDDLSIGQIIGSHEPDLCPDCGSPGDCAPGCPSRLL